VQGAFLLFLPIAVAIAGEAAETIPKSTTAAPPIRTAQPIRLASPAVLRGDKVQVSVWSGSVLLQFEAEAESTGRAGETVMIRNPENGRRFAARVEEKGKVVIKR
jgi:flagella basal body P-ring formation protein FlgA